MLKSKKNITVTLEYRSSRRLPMPPPTRAIPMKKRQKLDKIARREMAW